MAFFSNSGSRADSGGYNLNEKADDEGAYESVRDRDVDLNSGHLNLNEKADDAYHSEEEQYEAGQSGLNSSEIESGQNAQRVGGPSGPWGTNFLKDCRSTQTGMDGPSNSHRAMENGYVASSHDDMDGSGEDDELNRGNGDVPAEEMLSDDYYEQDEEDQIDSLNRRGMSHPSSSHSAVAAKSVPSRQKKSTKHSAYDDDDDDAYDNENDDDDDDDADGIFIPAALCSAKLTSVAFENFPILRRWSSSSLTQNLFLPSLQKMIQMM
jgi:chromodomain-helicase-DNA-binding protein 1